MKNQKTKVYVGMDVHKDTVIGVLPAGAREPTLVKRLSHDPRGIRRLLDRLAREHEVRACYEASGAGYVLERMIRSWGHKCEIVAPSLIPRRPGERRKHDRKDAEELARLYRAGELVTIRVPTEREERVRDLVRCRETFQREALKSRHYILKFLARRGLVYREGQNWTVKHFAWLRAIQRDEVLETEDHVAAGLQAVPPRRAGPPDRGAGTGTGLPGGGRPAVLPEGHLDAGGDGAGDGARGPPALRASGQADGVPGSGAERAFERVEPAARLDHEGGQQPGPACAGAGRVELPVSAAARARARPPTGGPAAGGDRAQLEGTAPASQGVREVAVFCRSRFRDVLCNPNKCCKQRYYETFHLQSDPLPLLDSPVFIGA